MQGPQSEGQYPVVFLLDLIAKIDTSTFSNPKHIPRYHRALVLPASHAAPAQSRGLRDSALGPFFSSIFPCPHLGHFIQVHSFKIHLEAVSPQIQPILMTHGFHTCKFAYLLKFVAPKSILAMPLRSCVGMSREAQTEFPRCISPAEVEQGDTLLSCFNSHAINKYHFYGPVSVMFFISMHFVDSWVKTVPKCSDECRLVFPAQDSRDMLIEKTWAR